jgi:hypothetical protein
LGLVNGLAHSHFQELALRALQQAADAFHFGVKLWQAVELETLGQNLFADFIALGAIQSMLQEHRIARLVGLLKSAHLGKLIEFHTVGN